MAESRRRTFTIDLDAMVEAAQQFRSTLDKIFTPGLELPPAPAGAPVGLPFDPGAEQAPLIGLGGLKEHGKTAFARFLVQDHGYAETFMAAPLTNALEKIGTKGPWVRLDRDVHGYGEKIFPAGSFMRYSDILFHEGYDAAKQHRDVREYLQGLGTEVGRRMFSESVWVDTAREKILQVRAAGTPVVITGIRYQNEIELIRELGGLTVWVERTSWPEKQGHELTEAIDAALQAPQEDTTATHSSETSLTADDFDVVVENDSTLDALRLQAEKLHEEIVDGMHGDTWKQA